jgi:hypothetical protein
MGDRAYVEIVCREEVEVMTELALRALAESTTRCHGSITATCLVSKFT